MKRTITYALIILLPILLMSNISTTDSILSGLIDLNYLENYSSQTIPNYILKDNTPRNNDITDAGATLGRVLFYDKNLSSNNTVSCASCHLQEFAFGDTARVSVGVSGSTGRHSMRLVNARFGTERNFFWDERADNLEEQTTMPIADHVEMGFSGTNGDDDFNDLIDKLEDIDYYNELFQFAYGDSVITEERMQIALAQFIRSIQSFDSKYDIGRAQVAHDSISFTNFTEEENLGKFLFSNPTPQGAACGRCHAAPEFDIARFTQNNGVIGVANDSTAVDLTITRSPSLRNLFDSEGELNGSLMHDGSFDNLLDVINHYNQIVVDTIVNPDLDPRLIRANGTGQNLNLTEDEKLALIAFIKTLSGEDVYSDERWSDPFDTNGDLTIISFCGIGSSCDDGDTCTAGEVYDDSCNCTGGIFQDEDGDGVCNSEDVCHGGDDTLDDNDNGIPDACENGCPFDLNNFNQNWGIWNDGGADCRRSPNDAPFAASGNRCVRLADNTSTSVMTTNSLDLSSYNELSVNFSFITEGMEIDEDFWLQISTDGGISFTTLKTWTAETDFINNQRVNNGVIIQGPFTSNSMLRFRCDASNNDDRVYIDDVEILGCSVANKSISINQEELDRDEENKTSSLSDEIQMTVYPNPFAEQINLIINGIEQGVNADVIITDLQGKIVFKEVRSVINGHIHLDNLKFNSGVYLIRVAIGSLHLTKRAVVIN